jgi:hypothetical protein
MQWTTGDASSGVGGFGGFAATVGVNIGNGVDFFQVGQFDAPGTGFDGPYALTDQVDFLDDQEVYFDVAGMNVANIPPLVINSNICDTIDVYTGDTLHKSMNLAQFTLSLMTPEFGQILTYGISSDAPTGFSYLETVNNSDYVALECSFDAQGLTPGMYHINVSVSDNGSPAASIERIIPVRVHASELASLAQDKEPFELEMFPNPTSGKLNFRKDNAIDRVEIYALSGKFVGTKSIAQQQIDLEELSEGIYFLHMFQGDTSLGTVKVSIIQ